MLPFGRTKIWLIIAACGFLLAFCVYAFLFFEIKQTNERVSAQQNDIEAQTKREDTLFSKRALTQDTAELREKLSSYLVAKSEAVSFIESLEALGEQSGTVLSIKAVEPVKIESGKAAVEKLRIALEARGPWQNVLRFLGSLELLAYESEVEQVALSHEGEGGEWRGQFTLEILKEK